MRLAPEGTIQRSDNALAGFPGALWTAVRPREGFVSSLVCDPRDSATVYATYATFGGAHVWKSTDGGTNWRSLDGAGATALPDLPVHALAIDPRHPERLYLGTDLGVFVSLDGGATWTVEDAGIPHVVTESFVVAPGPSGVSLFAFTHGRGVWKTQLPD